MAIYADVAGVQKVVETPFANVGGTWYAADRVFQKRAGVWELVWPAPAVVALTASAPDWETVNLSWSVSGVLVDHYEVLRGSTVLVAQTTDTSYVDGERLGGTTYTYTVRGYRDGNIAAEATEQVTTPARADMGLAAGSASWDEVPLTWTDPDGGADAYRVRRDGDVIVESQPGKAFTDTGRSPSTSHEYLVEALRTGVVVGSDTVVVETPAYPSLAFSATATAWNSVSLGWASLDGSADQAVLDRGTTNIYQGADKTSHTDSGRSASTTYNYTLKHRRSGVVLASSSKSATTPARPTAQTSVTLSGAHSASFNSSGGNRGVAEMYGGYYGSNHGRQKSQVYFAIPDAVRSPNAIRVDAVEISFFTRHHYYNSGGKVRFAPHRVNASGGFGNFTGAQYPTFGEWSANKGAWVGGVEWLSVGHLVPTGWGHNMNTEVHSQGCWGIAIYAPNDTSTYYGYWDGAGQQYRPRMRITYTYYS